MPGRRLNKTAPHPHKIFQRQFDVKPSILIRLELALDRKFPRETTPGMMGSKSEVDLIRLIKVSPDSESCPLGKEDWLHFTTTRPYHRSVEQNRINRLTMIPPEEMGLGVQFVWTALRSGAQASLSHITREFTFPDPHRIAPGARLKRTLMFQSSDHPMIRFHFLHTPISKPGHLDVPFIHRQTGR